MGDYERSKAIETVDGLGFFPASLRDGIVSGPDSPEARFKAGQAVLDAVCERLSIPKIRLSVRDGCQLHKDGPAGSLRRKTLGRYWHLGSSGRNIEIWNRTAKLGKTVAAKTFFGTLCHELCHHVDVTKLGILSSPHTSGFYRRVSCIERSFTE